MRAKHSAGVASFSLGAEELVVIAVPALDGSHFPELTCAEGDVCRLALAGLSNADIARVRDTSVNTVENQLASIFRKLDIASRTELAALARARG